MDKVDKTAMEKYIEFSKVIKDMYLKIIRYEMNDDKENSEYKAIIDVLPTAVEIENKYLKKMNITPSTIKEVKFIMDRNIGNLAVDVINLDSDDLDVLRRSNKTDDIELELMDRKEIPSVVNSIMELVEVKNAYADYCNTLFTDQFLYVIINNIVKITDDTIKSEKNKFIRDYLINFKYRIIGTTPKYEDFFLTFRMHPTPIKTFSSIYMENFDDETLKNICYTNVKTVFLSDLTELMEIIDNGNLTGDNLFIAERLVITNQARLMALDDMDLIEDLEAEVIPLIILADKKELLGKYISRIFSYVRENTLNKRIKKELDNSPKRKN